MLYRNIYAVLATAVGCEQPSQRVVLTFLARGFVTICDYIVEFIPQLLTVRNCGISDCLQADDTFQFVPALISHDHLVQTIHTWYKI